jgi:hypothetical protein
VMCGDYEARPLREVYGYRPGWGTLGPEVAAAITEVMMPRGLEEEKRSIEMGEGDKPLGRGAPTTAR